MVLRKRLIGTEKTSDVMAVIGINALFLIPNKVGGTEYLLRSFLSELEVLDQKNKYVVFCNQENFLTFSFKNPGWNKILCNIPATNRPLRLLYEQVVLPAIVRRNGCDLLHSFGYFGPFFCPVPHVITVHDVNWRDRPDDVDRTSLFILRHLIEANLFTAKKIITDSQFSKQRLMHYFPHIRSKLYVVKPAVSQEFRELLKRKLKRIIGGKYFLCVSGFYPHKQVPKLLRSWKKISPSFPHHKLIIVGQNGKDQQTVEELIRNDDSVQYFAKVSFSELVSLYEHAVVFLFPSEYEGFGYPVYEAAEAGAPVIVRDKKMYDSRLARSVFESDFTPDDILKKIHQAMGKGRPQVIGSNESAARQIMKIYEET